MGRPLYFTPCGFYLLSFLLSFLLAFFLSFFFLAYSQRSQIRCLPYFHTWSGLSANLESISSQLRHASAIGKMLLNRNILWTCPHNMVNFGQLATEIGWRVWGTPANFNGFRVLASLLQRRRSTEVNQTLHNVWPSPALVHYSVSTKKRPPSTMA